MNVSKVFSAELFLKLNPGIPFILDFHEVELSNFMVYVVRTRPRYAVLRAKIQRRQFKKRLRTVSRISFLFPDLINDLYRIVFAVNQWIRIPLDMCIDLLWTPKHTIETENKIQSDLYSETMFLPVLRF